MRRARGGPIHLRGEIQADHKQAPTLCGLNACIDTNSRPVEYAHSQCSSPAARRLADAEPLLARARLLAPHRQLRCADYYHVGDKLGEGSFGNVYEDASCSAWTPRLGGPCRARRRRP
ncbi:unnamed protein product [Prorocentrum cordatum]|uniref:Non-specific serine/threonine protein kinase n=1 Tax=Prorocentrum cordatum TaxID=2364126 RepID=A0ABN9UT69_9DINO|nr:unnamed protein product [Polarella glacialis]